MLDVGEVRRIAVLVPEGIGDVVFCLPALDALHGAFPDAEIVMLGPAWAPAFFAGRPGPVARAVAAPPVRDAIAEHAGFFSEMVGLGFDVAVQLYGGGRESNAWTLALGAPVTVGLATRDATPLDAAVPYRYYQHEVMRRLEVVALLGAAPVTLEPRLAVTDGDVARSLAVLPEDDRPLAVLLPGVGDARRRWPTERFAKVGDELASAGAGVAVCGGADAAVLGEGVRAAMGSGAEDLCGRLDLNGLLGLLSRASVAVGNDTGPLHLAEAAGSATVGVYWCGNVVNAAPLSRTRHRVLLSWRLACPVCGTSCIDDECAHDASFVAEVSTAHVAAEALDLLGR